MCKRKKLFWIFSFFRRDNAKKQMSKKNTVKTEKAVTEANGTADVTRELNERYNQLEQAERNYAWVHAWRSAYSCTLGFSDSFEKINEYTLKHAQTMDPIYQTELDDAIQHSCVRFVDETLKRLLDEKATPKQGEFVDICAEYQGADGDRTAQLEEYLKRQECSFGAYADGTAVMRKTYIFIEELAAFWEKARGLLADKQYEEYRSLYADFLNSESLVSFIGSHS